jgi:hypothetical protein
MLEVTSDNFEDVLPLVVENIREANFVGKLDPKNGRP